MKKSRTTLIINEGVIDLEVWLQFMLMNYNSDKKELIHQAATMAQLMGVDAYAPTGQSCFQQSLYLAEILFEINADSETIAAGLIYNCVCYAGLTLDDVSEQLSPSIAKLIQGTQKMDALQVLQENLKRSPSHNTIDNLRKMLLAIVDDVRIVFIKLAERLSILRHIASLSDPEKWREAKITHDIYAPLANRLGIGHLKWELEDLSFRYLETEKYKNISKALKATRQEREIYVAKLIQILSQAVKEMGIEKIDVSGRAKHIYSIYKKMTRKNVDLEEIYDITAFRVLVPSVEDCYAVLGYVHSLWKPIKKEFDDYIVKPKLNGYRSIHTAVMGLEDKIIEIQIRTFEMHQQAELGVAAHWIYKEGRPIQTGYEAKIAWLRQVMDWQKELTQSKSATEKIYSQIFDDYIYVFTPQGDVIELIKDATPLDFAYHIHSGLGHRCRGAKVNGQIVPLIYTLKMGECVEILTTKQEKPSRDWMNPNLGYLKTARARTKVSYWFRQKEIEKNPVESGVLPEKKDSTHKHEIPLNVSVVPTKVPASPEGIQIQGISNLLTHTALCCKPIPGDLVIGYVTQGQGVSIHKQNCPNILHVPELHKKRLVEVSWGEKAQNRYNVDLVIEAFDQHTLIRDITQILVNDRISILGLTWAINKKEATVQINLSIEIHGLNSLGGIIHRISQIPNVTHVRRV